MTPAEAPVTSPEMEEEWGDDVGGGSLINWKVPQVVIGIYRGMVEQTKGKYATEKNPSYKVTIDEAKVNGEFRDTIAFFAPSALKSRLDTVKEGSKIRIEFDGTTTTSGSGRPVKNFTVQVAKS